MLPLLHPPTGSAPATLAHPLTHRTAHPQVDPGAVSLDNICEPGQPTAGFPNGATPSLSDYYCNGNVSSNQICKVCVCVCVCVRACVCMHACVRASSTCQRILCHDASALTQRVQRLTSPPTSTLVPPTLSSTAVWRQCAGQRPAAGGRRHAARLRLPGRGPGRRGSELHLPAGTRGSWCRLVS